MTGVLIRGEKERETTGKRPYEDTVKKKKQSGLMQVKERSLRRNLIYILTLDFLAYRTMRKYIYC